MWTRGTVGSWFEIAAANDNFFFLATVLLAPGTLNINNEGRAGALDSAVTFKFHPPRSQYTQRQQLPPEEQPRGHPPTGQGGTTYHRFFSFEAQHPVTNSSSNGGTGRRAMSTALSAATGAGNGATAAAAAAAATLVEGNSSTSNNSSNPVVRGHGSAVFSQRRHEQQQQHLCNGARTPSTDTRLWDRTKLGWAQTWYVVNNNIYST